MNTIIHTISCMNSCSNTFNELFIDGVELAELDALEIEFDDDGIEVVIAILNLFIVINNDIYCITTELQKKTAIS